MAKIPSDMGAREWMEHCARQADPTRQVAPAIPDIAMSLDTPELRAAAAYGRATGIHDAVMVVTSACLARAVGTSSAALASRVIGDLKALARTEYAKALAAERDGS